MLFAFLLMAPLSARFPQVTTALRLEYFMTLLAAGAAATLLMAPTAYHRILFRCGDKEHLVAVANRFTLAGLAFVGVAMLGSPVFVAALLFAGAPAITTATIAGGGMLWCWCVAPLRRRRELARRADPSAAPAGVAEPGTVVALR